MANSFRFFTVTLDIGLQSVQLAVSILKSLHMIVGICAVSDCITFLATKENEIILKFVNAVRNL